MEKEITCLSNLLAKMRQAWDLEPSPSFPSFFLHSPRMEAEKWHSEREGEGGPHLKTS